MHDKLIHPIVREELVFDEADIIRADQPPEKAIMAKPGRSLYRRARPTNKLIKHRTTRNKINKIAKSSRKHNRK